MTLISLSRWKQPLRDRKAENLITTMPTQKSLQYSIWSILAFVCGVFFMLWTCLLVNVVHRRTTATTIAAIDHAPSTHFRGSRGNKALSFSPNKGTSPQRWFWIGMVRDAVEVPASTWDALAHAACSPYQVHVHIVVGTNAAYATDQLVTQRIAATKQTAMKTMTKQCASVYIESEHDLGLGGDTPLPSNRVERIAMIRDAQRKRIKELYRQDDKQGTPSDLRNNIVIVADLDLFRLPPVTGVLAQADEIATHDAVDVVCAAGVTMASREELWYYDTYATVLLPDTYVHPLKRRLVKEYFPGEDHTLVRSDNQHGSFTQGDLMRYLQQQADTANTGTVQVRSCFGGLTIYRAATWLEPACRYSLPTDPETVRRLERYASESDRRPCEHVVLHTCLQDVPSIRKARIAINPHMLTLWRKN